MKRTGFKRLSYAEALVKKQAKEGRSKPSKPRKVIAQRSDRLKALQGVYSRVSKAFLAMPENHRCAICIVRGIVPPNLSTETHHFAGRIGRLLCYVPYFIPSCFPCREWPHQNARQARELGVLAPAPQWNVYPVERV